MNKILDVVEDIKENITDNQYKIIMDSLMEIKNEKEKVLRFYYSQKEFDEMTKVMVKLSIDIFYEYTDDAAIFIMQQTVLQNFYIIMLFTYERFTLDLFLWSFQDSVEMNLQMMIFIQDLEVKLIQNFALMTFKTHESILIFLFNRKEDFVNAFSANIVTTLDCK